jgi:hypothetical protein
LEKHHFLPHEIFNWDVTGFVIEQGKPHKAISKDPTAESPNGGQAESITCIDCVSASGWSMLPWFLVKGARHQEDWYTSTDIDGFRIRPTDDGWTDDTVALEWLVSFNEASKNLIQKGRPRLLLMDNHPSHCTIEFMDYCNANSIIPCYFIPNTSHLIQPLDGQVFQTLKHWFESTNNEEVMWDGSACQKRDFFRIIGDVRRRSFTQRTIRSSFKSRGIYPVNAKLVIEPLLEELNEQNLDLAVFDTPSPEPSSSATNSPPNTAARVAKLNRSIAKDAESFEKLSKRLQKHLKRSMDANVLLCQRIEQTESELKKVMFDIARANGPKNRRAVRSLNRTPLGPATAQNSINARRNEDSRRRIRQAARHEQPLIAERAAQLERDNDE